MKVIEIEVGGIYEGKTGEHRKVVRMPDGEVKFEVVANPNPRYYPGWGIGSTNQIFSHNFAKWAQKRIA